MNSKSFELANFQISQRGSKQFSKSFEDLTRITNDVLGHTHFATLAAGHAVMITARLVTANSTGHETLRGRRTVRIGSRVVLFWKTKQGSQVMQLDRHPWNWVNVPTNLSQFSRRREKTVQLAKHKNKFMCQSVPRCYELNVNRKRKL